MKKDNEKTAAVTTEKPIETQAQEQTGQTQVQLRVDESKMGSIYANAFRTNNSAEEVMLDFGVNMIGPVSPEGRPQILFQVNQRVVLNYYSAKRLC